VDLRGINAELRAEGEPELKSYVPRETLREMEGLTTNLRRTALNMEAAYIELWKEEGDIGVIKDELERERARDDPDQNKLKQLKEEVKEREREVLLC